MLIKVLENILYTNDKKRLIAKDSIHESLHLSYIFIEGKMTDKADGVWIKGEDLDKATVDGAQHVTIVKLFNHEFTVEKQ